jgi:hypothetical protein
VKNKDSKIIGKSRRKNNNNVNVLPAIILLILIGIISVASYLWSIRNDIDKFLKTSKSNSKAKTAAERQKILDCAKKIAFGKDLLAQEGDADSCVYVGCGNFFQ